MLLDIFLPQKFIRHKQEPDIEAFCQREKCKCDDKENIWHSAYKHTEKISIFIFIFSLIVNAVFAFGGRETVQLLLTGMPILSKFIAAGVGLIPSCYPSVLLTQLYLDNAITLGTMLAGTLSKRDLRPQVSTKCAAIPAYSFDAEGLFLPHIREVRSAFPN